MSQIRITKQRRPSSARRRGQAQSELPLDPRDPDIVAAKQLQRRSTGTGPDGDDLGGEPGAGMS
jgi:hypothetical protein